MKESESAAKRIISGRIPYMLMAEGSFVRLEESGMACLFLTRDTKGSFRFIIEIFL